MTISYDVSGDGPAVLLLHSGVTDRRMWDGQVQPLVDAGYRVVRPDLRGFGDTPLPPHTFDNADDVAGLLDFLNIRQVTLVGSSYGGEVALEVAARWPGLVDGLVLLGSALPGHAPSFELQLVGEREEALVEAGDLQGAAQLMVDTFLGPDADAAAGQAVLRMQMRAYELQTAAGGGRAKNPFELAAIKAPTLVVSGAHDLDDFRQIATHVASQIADAYHVELPWAGHLPSLERPSATADLLIGFLRRPR
ncbi:alpha/beta fold hydrolase [Nonomuraea soli]|uniref:Pimeloyl-ACP methyl ester carboxylesterase n=1 Tax=Nonomuraea soli TaxID=1032476 RepID=A0A7W0CI20_9ACTN|nr:alpha/beta fold hydrolase [Nonomuraea soli]MBA2891553.1 pimeloyl-ACP methyl ester carboxylesterase [Nonomuraea soli]